MSCILRLAVCVTLLSFPATLPAQQNKKAIDLYEKGMNALSGSSTSRSVLDAASYMRQSAELGYAPAQVMMGYLSKTGAAALPSAS